MYYPLLRARQFELIALRELAIERSTQGYIVPILEPVRESHNSPGKVNETIKARLLREKISFDLSKPMRRYDSELDYIPTQFICEFIKIFTGSSGIRFKSSLHPAGRNVVIFDQTLMECSEVVLKRVNSLNLSAINLI